MSFASGGYNFKIEDKVPSAKWRFDPSKAGPSFALGDVGTHPLFIIEAMIPDMKIDNLMCTKRSFVEGRELEDNAFVIMNPQGQRKRTGRRSGILLGKLDQQRRTPLPQRSAWSAPRHPSRG